ncbi:MAG TPA: ISAs1 family transposase [Parachlamydiaceae bacterium]|nr:ISAs1 family transposase [Parachlamydiaceae bacterium]
MAKKKETIKREFIDIEMEINIQTFRESVILFFRNVPDPRVIDNCQYSLPDLLITMLLAVFSGADDIADIHEYANQKWKLLQTLFGPEFEPPSYNTFWWLLARINPKAFSDAFYDWVKDIHICDLAGKQINVDGKSLRGAINKKGNCNVHIVHAWVHEEGMLIGQLKTDEKSNEITAIPILLGQIDISGATVSIDAAGCQKNIVKTIREAGGNYLLAVKENQPKLYEETVNLFNEAHKDNFNYVLNCDRHENIEKKSGRIEKRSITVISDPSEISIAEEWKDLETLVEVINETTAVKSGKVTSEKRYYISNLIDSAQEFGVRVRGHWGVESMHWTLDVTFKEDDSRANTLHAAVNLGTLRRAALNIVKSDQELKKKGMAKVRRQAKWNEDGSIIQEILGALFSVKSF